MIARVRRWLRRIRYYSAAPERTMWARARDRVLFVSFLLAIPAALASSFATKQSTVVSHASGRIVFDDLGGVQIELDSPDAIPIPFAGNRFAIQLREHSFGWPWATWRQVGAVEFRSLNRIDSTYAPLTAAAIDEPIREAIARALAAEAPMLHARLEAGSLRWIFFRWLMTFAVWWVILYMLGLFALLPVRIVLGAYHRRKHRHRQERGRSGYCMGCGYNLRGLEFQARCPECGRLAH